MKREVIKTSAAPGAIGPYSQAIRAGDLVFCSGQIPLDPATGEMVGGDDVVAQAKCVMSNLKAVIEAGGSDVDHVVKCTIFLIDMADFAAVNEVYGETFNSPEPPARACFAVRGLPKGAKVEVEAIAVVKG